MSDVMIWFKVFLSNIGCVDHLAISCGASKFMGFEDILVVPVGEFSFTSPPSNYPCTVAQLCKVTVCFVQYTQCYTVLHSVTHWRNINNSAEITIQPSHHSQRDMT